jgi:hypothetical protein
MARKNDPIKVSLADLVFEASKIAFNEVNGGGHALAPEHSPLEDCIIEVVPISDLQVTVRVSGQGMPRYFTIMVSEQSN